MRILGLGGSVHSYSACIVEDGKVIVAIEEERLNKVKHSFLPFQSKELVRNKAVSYCLEATGLSLSDIDMIVGNDLLNPFYYSKFDKKIKLINHHLTHASSCYFTSDFSEAAILVVDGCGGIVNEVTQEYETTSTYYASGNNIEQLSKVTGSLIDGERRYAISNEFSLYNSIGGFYKWVTIGLGFDFLQDGKTMGLSAFGNSKYIDYFHQFYHLDSQMDFIQSREQVRELLDFIRDIIEECQTEKEKKQEKANIAFACQYHLEQILIKKCQWLFEKTKSDNLCISGGVALNSIANYKILKQTPFKKISIFPAAGDNGTSIGAALYVYHVLNSNSKRMNINISPYLGKEYQVNISDLQKKYDGKVSIHRSDNICKIASKKLNKGKIIGWYQGKSEFGPRALGNRSILADPRILANKQRLNSKIKKRESFRPFAPAVLEEYQYEYFELKHSSPYMLFVSPIHLRYVKDITAVAHVDNTARVQTVSKYYNPLFYELIQEFHKLSNCPILLNTSLNTKNSPIVESPEDAIETFLDSDLDELILGEYLIEKLRHN